MHTIVLYSLTFMDLYVHLSDKNSIEGTQHISDIFMIPNAAVAYITFQSVIVIEPTWSLNG